MKPILFSTQMVQAILAGQKTQTRRIVKYNSKGSVKPNSITAGDILWVRETWCRVKLDGNYAPACYQGEFYYYKADGCEIESCGAFERWRPSIFMPREACRLFLKVTNVRVERLQEITVDDCRLEGCCCSDCLQTGPHSPDCKCDTLFHNVWNDINAKRGYGWQTNPWVWVYEFKKVDKPKGV